MVADKSRDRGQVILIGALVIAFAILGVVVILNGLVHAEEVASGGVSQEVTDAGTTQTELVSNIQGIVAEEYNGEYVVSDPAGLERNVIAYLQSVNEVSTNERSSMLHVDEVVVGTDNTELARANNDIIGPSAGSGQGNNIWIDQDESIAEEVYRFTYEVNGDNIVTVEFVGVDEEIHVNQENEMTEISYNSHTCEFSHQDVTIDFFTGEVNGEQRDCNPGIIGIVDEVNHTDIERVSFSGSTAEQQIGEYDIIAKDVQSGNADWINGTEGPVSFVDVEFTHVSHGIVTDHELRITGFGEIT